MSDRDTKVINEYMNSKLDKVAQDMGRTRQEVYEGMKKGDKELKSKVDHALINELRGATNSEVREAAKRLKNGS
jgi:hypothetical protein